MQSLQPGNAAAAADPLTADEFAGLLAGLGPWDAGRRVAVAVSGGADSLCLALLAHGWGDASAIIVDHGLRTESAAEAAWTARALRSRGMPARVVALDGLHAGPALAARARSARYAILAKTCREAGIVDLLVGHHAADQAETVLMRQRHGSGPIGLAGMAASDARESVRIVRPLLAVAPGRLRATLRHLGQPWVEDPSNADPAAARTRLRAELAAGPPAGLPGDAASGARRVTAEREAARELAACATIYPAGFALIGSASIGPLALGMVLRAIGGRAYRPPPRAVAALSAALRPATLAGVQVLPAGRWGNGWLVVREAAAMAPAVPLVDGAVWDGRFRVAGAAGEGFTLGALGASASRFRKLSPLPAAVLRSLPAIWCNNALSAVPHLAYADQAAGLQRVRLRHAGAPVCPAPFVAI